MKKIILFSALLNIFYSGICQENNGDYDYLNISGVVPSAAEFQAMKHLNRAQCNGKIDVNIPLYHIKHKNIDIPIYLSYNTSGIKVAGIASRVGSNWHLTAAGMITRLQRGALADEMTESVSTSEGPHDYYGFQNHSYQDICDLPSHETNDMQPDLFFLTAPGLSTVFSISRSKKAIEIQGDDITLNVNDDFTAFEIKASNGNKYYFNNYSTVFKWNQWDIKQNWYLSKIEYASGEVVTFNYDNEGGRVFRRNYSYTYPPEVSQNCPVQIPYSDPSLLNNPQDFPTQIMHRTRLKCIEFETGKIDFNYSHNRKDIIVDSEQGGDLAYNIDYALSSIEVKNFKSNIIKSIELNYDYLLDNAGNSSRLLLDYISFKDSNGLPVEEYGLTYNKGTFPRYDSYKFDYYGFYADNGQSDISTKLYAYFGDDLHQTRYYPFELVNTNLNVEIFSGADRTPNLSDMRTGMLKQIHYPTGGILELQYEMNDFRIPISHEIIEGGGLQIKKQVLIDNESNGFIKEYQYLNPKVRLPRFAMLSTNPDIIGPDPSLTELSDFIRNYTAQHIDNQVNFNLLDGSPVIYETVEEIQPGNGKIIYCYNTLEDNSPNPEYCPNENYDLETNSPLTYNPPSQWPYFKGRSFRSLRGTLKEKWIFNEEGKVVKGEGYVYNFRGDGDIIYGHEAFSPYCFTVKNTYPLVSGAKVLLEKYTLEFSEDIEMYSLQWGNNDFSNLHPWLQDNAMIKKEYFSYNDKAQLKSHYILMPNNKEKNIYYKYSNEYDFTDYDLAQVNADSIGEHIEALYDMSREQGAWMIDKPIEKRITTNRQFTYGEIIGYTKWGDFYKPSKVYKLNVEDPINICDESMIYWDFNLNKYFLKYHMNYEELENFKFDIESGLLMEYWKNNDLTTSYKWGYNDRYPIAEIKNAKDSSWYFDGFESGTFDENIGWGHHGAGDRVVTDETSHTGKYSVKFTDATSWSGVYLNSPYIKVTPGEQYTISAWFKCDETKYAYINWYDFTNGVSHTKTKQGTGKWTYIEHTYTVPSNCEELRVYLYGHHTNSNTIYYDDIRVYPDNSQMNTYTYDPLIGITSKTDQSNNTTFYFYDEFGRLKTIKDNDLNIIKDFDYQYGNQ